LQGYLAQLFFTGNHPLGGYIELERLEI